MVRTTQRAREPLSQSSVNDADVDGGRLVKTQRSSYQKGAITRVEVKNFMAYDNCVLEPGPKLNLLIGPNGTGKSSWVCAICLGLGGHPKILGRSTSMEEYVKHGADNATIKIELESGRGLPKKITRVIQKNGRNEFYIDGTQHKMDHVRNQVMQMNIQLDNLCQFLPQDKVQNFASLNANDLLTETEKALTDRSLYDHHMSLIQKREGIRELEKRVERDMKKVEDEEALLQRYKNDKEQVENREQLISEAELRKQKRQWLKAWELQGKVETMESTVREKKQFKSEIDQEVERLKKPQREKEKKHEEVMEKRKKHSSQLQRFNNQVMEVDHKIRETGRLGLVIEGWRKAHNVAQENEITSQDTLMQNVRKENEDRQQKAELYKSQIEEAKESLAKMPDDPTDAEKTKKLKDQLKGLEEEFRNKDNEMRDIEGQKRAPRNNIHALDRRMKDMQDKKKRTLEALKKARPNVRIDEFQKWLSENRQRLRSPVYGPVGLELEVVKQEYAKMVEAQTSPHDLLAHVTSDEEDAKVLRERAEELKVSIYTIDRSKPLNRRNEEKSVEDLKQYGIETTLDRCVKAPDDVKEFLRRSKAFHRCFVGTMEAERNVDQLSKVGDIIFYTPEMQHSCISSKYDKQFNNTSNRPLFESRFLSGDQNESRELSETKKEKGEYEKQLQELDRKAARLKDERDEVERRRKEVRKELDDDRQASEEHKKKKREKEATIKSLERKLEELENAKDEQERIAEIEREKNKLREQQYSLELDCVDQQMQAVKKTMEKCPLVLWEAQLSAQAKKLKTNTSFQDQRRKQIEKEVTDAEKKLSEVRRQYQAAKSKASQEAELTDELKKRFEPLSNCPATLEEEEESKRAEAEGIEVSNPNAVQEYQDRSRNLEQLKQRYSEEKSELESSQQDIAQEKEQWLPKLRELIKDIDTSFRQNFARIGCRGEVTLDEEGEEFDKYAIEIKVAFRNNEEPQRLTASRQSGGERSLSTMLYLIALQNLTKSPFRVVDEINQGMDEANERHVYRCMVNAATEPSTPQSFVLTPKLLPQLEYTDDVRILMIMSGANMEEAARKMRARSNPASTFVWKSPSVEGSA